MKADWSGVKLLSRWWNQLEINFFNINKGFLTTELNELRDLQFQKHKKVPQNCTNEVAPAKLNRLDKTLFGLDVCKTIVLECMLYAQKWTDINLCVSE